VSLAERASTYDPNSYLLHLQHHLAAQHITLLFANEMRAKEF
jgi:hypothetical protein